MPTVELSSGGLRLAARHDPPHGPLPARGPRAAVVCHPHPLFGGTMDNKVVHAVARALREQGLHVLRFNFRGAGGSEGFHDEGRAELEDARAAVDRVVGLAGLAGGGGGPVPAGSVLVAGFSFGSFVGLSAALDDPRVGALLAIAPPVNHYDYSAIARTDRPLAVIYAAGDELVPAALVERFTAACRNRPRVTAISGTGHLFHAKLAELRAAVGEFLDVLQAAEPA